MANIKIEHFIIFIHIDRMNIIKFNFSIFHCCIFLINNIHSKLTLVLIPSPILPSQRLSLNKIIPPGSLNIKIHEIIIYLL